MVLRWNGLRHHPWQLHIDRNKVDLLLWSFLLILLTLLAFLATCLLTIFALNSYFFQQAHLLFLAIGTRKNGHHSSLRPVSQANIVNLLNSIFFRSLQLHVDDLFLFLPRRLGPVTLILRFSFLIVFWRFLFSISFLFLGAFLPFIFFLALGG